MVDRLPDPSIPLTDRDRARLRADVNQTVLQGFLFFHPPGFRAALFEINCIDPDLEAIGLTLTQAFGEKNQASLSVTDPAVVLSPELQEIFDDPVWQTLVENTAATSPAILRMVWQQHLAEGSPPGAHGVVVDGVDVDRLDADIGRCIDAFVESDALDSNQREILQASVTEANRILPQLAADAKVYFERLQWIAGLVARHASDAPAA
jgi:hypothetical protein